MSKSIAFSTRVFFCALKIMDSFMWLRYSERILEAPSEMVELWCRLQKMFYNFWYTYGHLQTLFHPKKYKQ